METVRPIDDERWRAEADGAVLDDHNWKWIAATVSPDTSHLNALYEFARTSQRVRVSLLRDKFRTVAARAEEIRRQLRLAGLLTASAGRSDRRHPRHRAGAGASVARGSVK